MSLACKGKCFCGAVEIEAPGAPGAMGYCHGASCRPWSAGLVNAITLWKPKAVKTTKGAEHIGKFMKTPVSDRQICTKFDGHVAIDHPPLGLTDVYAATISALKFEPAAHVNHGETVLRMKDGLPKLEDFPAEFGGSREMVSE